MSIDSNLGPTGPYGVVGPTGPEGAQGANVLDPFLMSTLSPSQQEALMVLYLMNSPILVQPNTDINNQASYTIDVSAIGAMVATKFEEIGSDIWDKYLNYLTDQKERIREELASPRYRAWVEDHKTPEMKNEIRSAVEYNEWINSLPAGQREEEILRNQASNLWSHYIEGVSNYISNVHDTNPEAAAFMVASFVITSAYIGDYMNIVDVASTKMVAVNPIQDAANSVLPIIPPNFQESVVLTINLFVIGAMYSSTAELLPKIKGGDQKELDFTAAKAYAAEVCDKVENNEINYFLMALLVNSSEEGAPITNERLNQLAAMVKMIMLSVALAILYKVEAGWLKGEDFRALIQGELQPRSDEEARLVSMFGQLQGSGALGEAWDNLLEALINFFESNPSVEDMLNPMRVYAGVSSSLPTTEAKG
jgi:hypothetical protein